MLTLQINNSCDIYLVKKSEDTGLWAFHSIQISLISGTVTIVMASLSGNCLDLVLHLSLMSQGILNVFAAHLVPQSLLCLYCSFMCTFISVFKICGLFEYVWGLGVGVEG